MTKQSATVMILLAVGMAACQREPEAAAPANPPAAAETVPAVKAKPLTADEVSVTMEPQGAGATNATTGKFEIPVKITNNGKVALSSAENPPVNIGVQVLAAADGSGAMRDLSRTALPQLVPGASVTVAVAIPADPRVSGHRLKIELVEEGVAWFSKLGQPGVEVGPYAVCDKSLCPQSGGAQ